MTSGWDIAAARRDEDIKTTSIFMRLENIMNCIFSLLALRGNKVFK